jgi:hypothetical protein
MIGKRSHPVREGAVGKRTSTAGTSPDGLPHPIQSLVAAFTANKAIVDESSTRAAVAEVTAD